LLLLVLLLWLLPVLLLLWVPEGHRQHQQVTGVQEGHRQHQQVTGVQGVLQL
jgi:hypothetical protein